MQILLLCSFAGVFATYRVGLKPFVLRTPLLVHNMFLSGISFLVLIALVRSNTRSICLRCHSLLYPVIFFRETGQHLRDEAAKTRRTWAYLQRRNSWRWPSALTILHELFAEGEVQSSVLLYYVSPSITLHCICLLSLASVVMLFLFLGTMIVLRVYWHFFPSTARKAYPVPTRVPSCGNPYADLGQPDLGPWSTMATYYAKPWSPCCNVLVRKRISAFSIYDALIDLSILITSMSHVMKGTTHFKLLASVSGGRSISLLYRSHNSY